MGISIATTRWLCLSYYIVLLLASTIWAHPEDVDGVNGLTINAIVQEENKLTEPCTALVKEIMSGSDRADLQCLTPSGMLYTIPHVDTQWIREKQSAEELFSGETMLEIPLHTLIDMETLTLKLASAPKLVNTIVVDEGFRNRRRLQTRARASGRKTVLVIRVQATNRATSPSESQLASDVFGDNGDVNNLRSQYLACSHNKMEFAKAADRDGRSTSIRNGVVTIHSGTSTSVGDRRMLSALYGQLQNQFSTDPRNLADFIMFCLPPGTMDERDIAYAWMNDYRSVYNDVHCSHVSAQMHEIGHNLNLAHSGMGNNEYADKSGVMGYSYSYDDFPYMCFNAAKSWQLGWYTDKARTILPLADGQHEYTGRLASIVDYKTTDANVLIKIQQTTSAWAFFLNYNAAKGMNMNTMEGRDQVLVTMKNAGNEENASELVSRLVPGEVLTLPRFNGKIDDTLYVKFLSLTDGVANVAIELSGPAVPAPSISVPPTNSPSIKPTQQPTTTIHPSDMPSDIPSLQPSKIPPSGVSFVLGGGPTASPSSPTQHPITSVPSASPTQQPSVGVPSTKPTWVPSLQPSSTPTFKPSTEPSILPTAAPSGLPSHFPSQRPSAVPSKYPSSGPSQRPSTKPSMVPSRMPSPFPSMAPSFKPSSSPSFVPSSPPSHDSTELESSVALEVTSIYNLNMVGVVCDGAQAYFDEVTKSMYGDDTETTFLCSNEDRNRKDRSLGERTGQFYAKTKTIFPTGSTPPLPSEYQAFLHSVLSSNQTKSVLPTLIGNALDPGHSGEMVTAETDSTVDPPILKVSFGVSSAGIQVLPGLCSVGSLMAALVILAT